MSSAEKHLIESDETSFYPRVNCFQRLMNKMAGCLKNLEKVVQHLIYLVIMMASFTISLVMIFGNAVMLPAAMQDLWALRCRFGCSWLACSNYSDDHDLTWQNFQNVLSFFLYSSASILFSLFQLWYIERLKKCQQACIS